MTFIVSRPATWAIGSPSVEVCAHPTEPAPTFTPADRAKLARW
jgi:hypothetical protein